MKKQPPKRGSRRSPEFKYPWAAWFARGSGRLVKGTDYDAQNHGMASAIRRNAAVRGYSVSLHIHDDMIEYAVVKRKGKK